MEKSSTIILLLLSIVCQVSTNHESHGKRIMSQEAQNKVNKLRSLMEKCYPDIPVMREDSIRFIKLVKSSPRPYTVVLFSYNATNPGHVEEFKQFKIAANHYYQGKAHFTRKKEGKLFRPLFFVALPYAIEDGNDEGAKARGLLGHSAVIISTGEELNLETEDEKLRYSRRNLWRIQYSDGHISASRFVEYVGEATGDIEPYKESITTFLYTMAYLLIALAVITFVHQKFFWLINNTVLWIVVFMIVYYVSCSAYIWSVLNKPEWSIKNEEKTEYVHSSMNHQLKAEGFMMGGVICSIPLMMWAFVMVTKHVHNSILKRVLCYPIALLTIYMIYRLEGVVASKRFYNLVWVPSVDLAKGSLRENQGHVL